MVPMTTPQMTPLKPALPVDAPPAYVPVVEWPVTQPAVYERESGGRDA